jgi:predicted dehydrogenase
LLEDLGAAINRDDVDLICLCPEPERRGRIAVQCAQAGKHLYIDKPLTTSVDEAHEVVAAVRQAGVRSQMFSLVRTPAAQRAKRILESGSIGELIGIHCELLFAKGVGGSADLSVARLEKPTADRFTFTDSKRELFCVGLYPLVLFQWLTQERIKTVYGSTSNYFFAEHQKNDVEDFASLMMSTRGGIQATLTVGRTGWSSHPSHGVHQIRLVGTDGCAAIDAFRPRIEIHSDGPAWRQPETPHPDDPMGFWSSTQKAGGVTPKQDWQPIASILKSDAAYFLDCLDEDRESDVPATVGAHAVEVILAGYESAAQRKTITIA